MCESSLGSDHFEDSSPTTGDITPPPTEPEPGYWYTAYGEMIRFEDMTDDHVRSAISKFKGFSSRPFLWIGKPAYYWIGLLQKEHIRRHGKPL